MRASIPQIITFLTTLFEQGLSYSSINSAKSAIVMVLSMCTGQSELGSSVLLLKFMKGIFQARPVFPKTNNTWDVGLVLQHLGKLSPPKALSLLWLSRKLVTLMALLSGHRGQSLYLLKRKDVEISEAGLLIRFNSLLKQSKPGLQAQEVLLPPYATTNLCVVATFQEYLKRTQQLRKPGEDALFICSVKPFGRASRDTIANWVKITLRTAGVNMKVFTAHSTRAASTSAAFAERVPLSTIIQTAGWQRDSTFRKFYNKPIQRDAQFGEVMLSLAK